MFRKLGAVSVAAVLTAATPAVQLDQGDSQVALDRLPADDLADIADGDRFAVPECRPGSRMEVC